MALGRPPGGSSPERGDVGGQRPGVLLHQVLIAERSVARISWQDAGPTRRRPLTAARSGAAAGAGGGDGPVEVVNVAEDGGDVG